MKVVWSDDATWALVALETGLAVRYSPDQAARVVEELVRRVERLEGITDTDRAKWRLTLRGPTRARLPPGCRNILTSNSIQMS
jgi:plasmid stabilization system protein ParE